MGLPTCHRLLARLNGNFLFPHVVPLSLADTLPINFLRLTTLNHVFGLMVSANRANQTTNKSETDIGVLRRRADPTYLASRLYTILPLCVILYLQLTLLYNMWALSDYGVQREPRRKNARTSTKRC